MVSDCVRMARAQITWGSLDYFRHGDGDRQGILIVLMRNITTCINTSYIRLIFWLVFK